MVLWTLGSWRLMSCLFGMSVGFCRRGRFLFGLLIRGLLHLGIMSRLGGLLLLGRGGRGGMMRFGFLDAIQEVDRRHPFGLLVWIRYVV